MNVLIGGDYCPRERVFELFNSEHFNIVLGEIKDLISKSDYSIVNLESPIVNETTSKIDKIGPSLKCSTKGIQALSWAGFNCVTLANNHFRDFGDDGVANTIETLSQYKLDHVGGGRHLLDASQTFYKEIAGKCLSIINCCEHEFSIATDNTGGSNPLNPIEQYKAIQEAKNKSDWVLVIIHGGHEHYQLPSPRMVETYHFFVDAGADAVVNHHQHCFSGFEVYNGKPIFYGLGNLCFDNAAKRTGIWTEGYMVSITFLTDSISFKLYPYCQCAVDPCIKLLPENSFDLKLFELNNIITNPELLKEETKKYYKSCVNGYIDLFEPINHRVYLSAKHRGWLPSLISKKRRLRAADFILCEAHRDILEFWLKNS